jgi:hypothetical protein
VIFGRLIDRACTLVLARPKPSLIEVCVLLVSSPMTGAGTSSFGSDGTFDRICDTVPVTSAITPFTSASFDVIVPVRSRVLLPSAASRTSTPMTFRPFTTPPTTWAC